MPITIKLTLAESLIFAREGVVVARTVLSFLCWCNSHSHIEGITTKKPSRATLSNTVPNTQTVSSGGTLGSTCLIACQYQSRSESLTDCYVDSLQRFQELSFSLTQRKVNGK